MTSEAKGKILYGTPAVSSGPDHVFDGEISSGTKTDEAGSSLCGQRAQYGTDRRLKGRKFQNHSGTAIDRL